MQAQIEERLRALGQEHEAGLKMLADLDNQRAELQQTLLRIGGAMQVLQELLSPDESDDTAVWTGGFGQEPPAHSEDSEWNGVGAAT